MTERSLEKNNSVNIPTGIISMIEVKGTDIQGVENCDCDKGCDCFDTGPCYDVECDKVPDPVTSTTKILKSEIK